MFVASPLASERHVCVVSVSCQQFQSIQFIWAFRTHKHISLDLLSLADQQLSDHPETVAVGKKAVASPLVIRRLFTKTEPNLAPANHGLVDLDHNRVFRWRHGRMGRGSGQVGY